MSAPPTPTGHHHRDGFNLVAYAYDWVARLAFAGAIQEAQLRLLPSLTEARHALMIGGGAGETLKAMLSEHPELKVTYLEASSKMISLAQARLSAEQNARVLWLHHTHEHLYVQPELVRGADALITFFFLDVLSPAEASAFIRWLSAQRAQRQGEGAPHTWRWLLADFYPHVGWRGRLVQLMYVGFRLLAGLKNQTLCDYKELAQSCGWEPHEEAWLAREMIYSVELSTHSAPRSQ